MGKKSEFRFFLLLFSALALVTILLPGFTTLRNAYQTGLWTSNVFPPDKATGFTFKLGGNIGHMVKWNRIRLGFPFKPVTIDIQPDHSIVQVRIEPDAIIVNILIMSVFGCVVLLTFIGIKRIKNGAHRAQGY